MRSQIELYRSHHNGLTPSGLLPELLSTTDINGAQGAGPAVGRLLWCVRSDKYLQSIERAGELMTHPIGAGMTAFVAVEEARRAGDAPSVDRRE